MYTIPNYNFQTSGQGEELEKTRAPIMMMGESNNDITRICPVNRDGVHPSHKSDIVESTLAS